MRCLAQPGEHHTKKEFSPQTRPNRLHNTRLLIQAPCTSALAPHLPFSPDLMRVTYACPLDIAALAFVPFGIALVRVRVRGVGCEAS